MIDINQRLFFVRHACYNSKECESPTGLVLAGTVVLGKGVYCEVESEGSRKTKVGTNEKKQDIRLTLRASEH